jgi:hypothetical protein
LRSEAVEGNNANELIEGAGSMRKLLESLAWKNWKLIYSNPFVYSMFSKTTTTLNFISPKTIGKWGKYRTTPKPSKYSLKELANQAGFDNE